MDELYLNINEGGGMAKPTNEGIQNEDVRPRY